MHAESGQAARLLMEPIHLGTLVLMIVLYALRLRRILSRAPSSERTPARGDHTRAIAYSYGILVMPWELEGYRRHPIRYLELVGFHLGIAVAIGISLTLPFAPRFIDAIPFNLGARLACSAAALVGCLRLVRRSLDPSLRAMSNVDDYFSLALLSGWLVSAALALPGSDEAATIVFFSLAALLHVYAPFSKIAHYIFWPFSRYYIGRHFGHRGVYPRRFTRALSAPVEARP
jgi:hypothetical protein